MSENNNIIKFIKRAIDISIDFEGLMDSIDFDSYLPERQENDNILKSRRYQIYKMNIVKAFRYCNDIINSIEDQLKLSHLKPNYLEKDDLTKFLIYQLYRAKQTRISSRQNFNRKKEVQYYIFSDKRLNNAFNFIPIKRSNNQYETKSLLNNFNWAKVLYLNELAICYSGLAKSSMSLGYAEESIQILEDIYPDLKTIENPSGLNGSDSMILFESRFSNENGCFTPSQILKLYTFALFCKGEAEKLLHEVNTALKTFQRIIQINRKCKEKGKDYYNSHSDYFAALLRKSQIYIDQGRGKEALDCINSLDQLDITDCRCQERDLEKAAALIDQKEYDLAFNLLQDYKKDEWANTFANRKARIYILRLLNELKENRPIDFERAVNEKGVLGEEYLNYEKTAEDLIRKAWLRKDGDSIKGACDKLAEYYQTIPENLEKSLKYYYLYLFENMLPNYSHEKIIDDWLGDKTLVDLLQDYKDDFRIYIEKERNRGNDSFLKDFYSAYLKKDIRELNPSQIDLIEKLKNSLVDIYYQKDKDIELEKIEIEYEKFIECLNKPKGIKGNPEKFITNTFFKNHIKNKKPGQTGMHIESITEQMKRNTTDFIKRVIGKSKMHINNNQIRNTLTVLRRWNSFTPSLSSSISKSKGGGYFLRLFQNNSSLGIVIDPGFDFLENFFSQGYKIGDIDLVLVSHAHPDHTDDLTALLSLIHEMNGRIGKISQGNGENKKNPILILSSGVFEHFRAIISLNEKELKDIIVVNGKDDDLEIVYNDSGVLIQAFSTTHPDLGQFKSLGFIISAINNDNHKTVLGYTGDIKWRQYNSGPPQYLKYFKDCNIVCVHIGSIINILKDKDFCNTFCENHTNPKNKQRCLDYNKCKENNFKNVKVTRSKLIGQTRDENHLYLAGITLFFNSLLNKKNFKLKLAIFSEFGEELKYGVRVDLYRKFNGWFNGINKNLACLPGDIGLEVDVFSNEVFCHCCKRFVKSSDIKPVPYGKEEAICFVCKECEEVLSTHQIDLLLKEYCENGRQLESVDSNRF